MTQPSKSLYSVASCTTEKKAGSWSICLDYGKLNDVTVKDAYSLPNQSQVFDALRSKTFFTSVDLAFGFWQVPVAADHGHRPLL